jgi:hypothetical protein
VTPIKRDGTRINARSFWIEHDIYQRWGGGGLCVPGVFTELVARAAAPPHWCLLAIKRARVSSEI